MLWVFKRTISKEPSQLDGSFQHTEQIIKLMDKIIVIILNSNFDFVCPITKDINH